MAAVQITEDQVLILAPDEPSKKSGKDLASPNKWVTKGSSEMAIWGECQGSGTKPYQTSIDIRNIAFKCSCPSRKFPCKHGIGLGLLYARQSQLFTNGEAPPWVSEWLQRRAVKEETKTERTDKPLNEEAQAKRQQAREHKVSEGIDELLVWINDLVRNGILNLGEKNYGFWDGMAKRMVDAQAPGLAGMVRFLGSTNFFKEGWQGQFLERLLNLYLIAKAYQNKDSLPDTVIHDVRSWVGFTKSQDELKEQNGIRDTWLVIGKQVSEEDNLTVEHNWLYGISTNQYALVLQFIVRGQGSGILLSPGMYLEAELVYFPSVNPMRAVIKWHITTHPIMPKGFFPGWQEVIQQETAAYELFPVRSERPFIVSRLLPVFFNNSWWLKDQANHFISIKENFTGIWKLLALSGGEPLDMVVVGKEDQYEPIGIWHQQTYKAL